MPNKCLFDGPGTLNLLSILHPQDTHRPAHVVAFVEDVVN